MIVLRQKAAPPKETNSTLGFLSGLSGLPAQIGQIQAYQQQQRQNEALNQAKIAESAANTNKINIQSSGLQSQQDALTALPGAFDTLHRQQNNLPATGPAGNLVAHQSVQPAQIGDALSALTNATGSNLSQVGDFQLDQDNLQGRNQARQSVLDGDFGQASALNAISQGQAIPEQFNQSGGIVSNLFDGGITPETLGVVESLIAENQGSANQSNAHAGLYDAQALVQPSEIALNEAQATKALREPQPNNGITVGPDGTIQIGGDQQFNPTGLNESKTKDFLYGSRANAANDVISDYDDDVAGQGFLGSISHLKDKALAGTTLGNQFVSDDYQNLDQAQRNFVNAILRRESGAVISEQEFDNAAKQYLPIPGDNDSVTDQKEGNRILSTQNMLSAAGAPTDTGIPQGNPSLTGRSQPQTSDQLLVEAEAAIAAGADPAAVMARYKKMSGTQ